MKKIACVFISALLILSLCSCSLLPMAFYQSQAARNPNATHVDYWQNGIPNTIPKFNYGKYDEFGASKTTDDDSISYMLSYDGVKKQDLDSYAAALKNAGFSISTTESYDSYSISASPKDSESDTPKELPPDFAKDYPNMFDSYPSVMVDLMTSDGTCTVTIMVDNSKK